MKKHKDLIVIIIILSLIFISIIVLSNIDKESNKNNNDVLKEEYILENDYSNFFSVNSCINKYYGYLNSRDTNSLLKILNSSYIENNNINSSNIYTVLGEYENIVTFTSKGMYKTKNTNKYYVYGYLTEDLIDEIGNKMDAYFEVDIDFNNNIFSLMPITQSMYNEVKNG